MLRLAKHTCGCKKEGKDTKITPASDHFKGKAKSILPIKPPPKSVIQEVMEGLRSAHRHSIVF